MHHGRRCTRTKANSRIFARVKLLNCLYPRGNDCMKKIVLEFVFMSAVAAVIGALSGALTSVSTREEITEMHLQKLADSIIAFEANDGKKVRSIDDIVTMKIATRRQLRDSWGNPIAFTRFDEGGFRLSSQGDPVVAEKYPAIKQSIYIEEVPRLKVGSLVLPRQTSDTK